MRSKLVVGLAVLIAGFLVVTNPVVGEAAGQITGKQIKNSSITGKDIKNHSLTAADVKGSIAGPAGPAGPAGQPGLVRAWALVNADATVARSTSGLTVTHGGAGIYCVTVPGIASAGTAPVVTLDYAHDDTSTLVNRNQAFVEVRSDNAGCPGATATVRALVRTYATNTSGALTSTDLEGADEPFYIQIP